MVSALVAWPCAVVVPCVTARSQITEDGWWDSCALWLMFVWEGGREGIGWVGERWDLRMNPSRWARGARGGGAVDRSLII